MFVNCMLNVLTDLSLDMGVVEKGGGVDFKSPQTCLEKICGITRHLLATLEINLRLLHFYSGNNSIISMCELLHITMMCNNGVCQRNFYILKIFKIFFQ